MAADKSKAAPSIALPLRSITMNARADKVARIRGTRNFSGLSEKNCNFVNHMFSWF